MHHIYLSVGKIFVVTGVYQGTSIYMTSRRNFELIFKFNSRDKGHLGFYRIEERKTDFVHQIRHHFGIRVGDQSVSVFLRTFEILFPWICELDS